MTSRPKKWKFPELWLAFFLVPWAHSFAGVPQVVITNFPPYNSFENLAGLTLNAAPVSNAIAVFIYVPEYGWVNKPTCAQPLTPIQTNGSWSADITTGGSDQLATRIAALLVPTNYNEPCVQGVPFLPTNIFSRAIASALVTRQSPGPRWVNFSGYDWVVKTSSGKVGPGPNYFSDNTNNLFLDNQGQLHLRITNRSNQWQCAELVSARTFGFGHYRFELASGVDNLNPSVVLGLFTWSDDPVYAFREIDVECSRWGNATNANNSQYVVQPYDVPGHLVRFAVPADVTNSTHSFLWESNRVTFQSQLGSYSPSPTPTNVLSSWTYALDVPQTGDENVRMNLWLFNGSAPTDHQEVEIVIKSFNFVPLGEPKPARLLNVRPSFPDQIQFDLEAELDRRYELSCSSNLLDWKTLGLTLATNIVIGFKDTNAGVNMRFFRATPLP